jgi:lysophospholipase L1-like esterase
MLRFGMTTAGVARLRESARRAAINSSLLVVSMLLAMASCELAIRLMAPQQLILLEPDLWEPADTVGWLHRPNANVRINTGEGTVDVFTDSSRYRVGRDGPSSGEQRVLVLGDSFMEALQVQYEESFPALLEAGLSRNLGVATAVRNAGVGGWRPEQYLLRAGTLIQREHFDLVLIAVYLGNDIVSRRYGYFPPRPHAVRYSFRMPASFTRVELINSFLRPANDFLEVRSHLYIFVRTRSQAVRMRLGLAPLNFPPAFLRAQRSAPDWFVTAEIIASIDGSASASGSRSVVVLIPAPFQVDSTSFKQYVLGFGLDPELIDLNQPNERLGDELRAQGLHVVDPLAELRAAHSRGERLFGSVDQHLTSTGHRLLADLVAPVAADLMRGGSRPASAESR